MQNSPNRNKGRGSRRGDQSETLIIPHISKEMLDVARQMAAAGKSRAEIEQAMAAMQQGGQPTQPTPATPAPQPARQPKPGLQIPRSQGSTTGAITPVSRRPHIKRGSGAPGTQLESPTQTISKTLNLPAQRGKTPPPAAAEPTQTIPLQGTQPQPVGESHALPTAEPPTATLPPQAAPQKAAKPAKAAKAEKPPKAEKPAKPAPAVPRTRAEAEAQLNERIRADHVWLSNPVLVRGLGLAPVVGAALDGQRALMLCVASLILITLTRVLAVAVCHLTHNRFRAVVYTYAAAMLYIPTYVLMYQLFGASLTLLGIYLPILAVEPAIVKRMEFTELESVKDALRHGFNNGLGMCVVLLLVGCLRELLATGAVFGHSVMAQALLPLAALPAGGFILVGALAAVWCAVANVYTNYKREEVSRLYANRKR